MIAGRAAVAQILAHQKHGAAEHGTKGRSHALAEKLKTQKRMERYMKMRPQANNYTAPMSDLIVLGNKVRRMKYVVNTLFISFPPVL